MGAPLDGLNFVLHDASVLDIELDPPNHVASLLLAVTTAPKTGPTPVRARLKLSMVSALVVTLQTLDGSSPSRGMQPIGLDELGSLLPQFNHPLTGFDFLDSKRDAIPRGKLVFEWFDEALPGSAHTLSFYFGVTHADGNSALLFYRVLFDEAVLSYPDGRVIPIDSFSPVGSGRWNSIGGESPDEAITMLPDPVPPTQVDGKLLGLVFVESETHLIRALAVGKAGWDGRRLRWLSPSDLTYDIPPELADEIRPRFPEMSRSGYRRLDGFDYWVILTAPQGASEDASQLVKTHLTRSGSLWRRIIGGRK
jgi:hypothetical protein